MRSWLAGRSSSRAMMPDPDAVVVTDSDDEAAICRVGGRVEVGAEGRPAEAGRGGQLAEGDAVAAARAPELPRRSEGDVDAQEAVAGETEQPAGGQQRQRGGRASCRGRQWRELRHTPAHQARLQLHRAVHLHPALLCDHSPIAHEEAVGRRTRYSRNPIAVLGRVSGGALEGRPRAVADELQQAEAGGLGGGGQQVLSGGRQAQLVDGARQQRRQRPQQRERVQRVAREPVAARREQQRPLGMTRQCPHRALGAAHLQGVLQRGGVRVEEQPS